MTDRQTERHIELTRYSYFNVLDAAQRRVTAPTLEREDTGKRSSVTSRRLRTPLSIVEMCREMGTRSFKGHQPGGSHGDTFDDREG